MSDQKSLEFNEFLSEFMTGCGGNLSSSPRFLDNVRSIYDQIGPERCTRDAAYSASITYEVAFSSGVGFIEDVTNGLS